MKIWVIEPHDACVTTRLKDRINRMGEEMGGSLPMTANDRIRREKRLFPRIPCFLLVDYAVQGCAYRAFVRNISADGAFIESQRAVPHGPDISLVISFLDDRHPVKISGEIVRASEQGLGVRFDPVADFLPDNLPS
jgi:hypothetical protein